MACGLCISTLLSLVFQMIAHCDKNGWMSAHGELWELSTISKYTQLFATGMDVLVIAVSICHVCNDTMNKFSDGAKDLAAVSRWMIFNGLVKACGCGMFWWQVRAVPWCLLSCAVSIFCNVIPACI
eukprot:TRINITY_DN159238_c0_g1_i1.p1 TRINITY_DN159238_c0_g1~~TRINITY_DN159238_c0_g1_i1.p1  ORF type:complete len:126 (-),score=2.92 TRINITY_DN159238_c0_g1_i1:79-456(-)